jgi:hypothetical protein
MTRRCVVVLGAAVLTAAPAFAVGALPEPVSYTKPVAGGTFVFVMLGELASEAKQSPSAQAEFRALRDKYPRSGLYPADRTDPVWTLDAAYAPYDNTFLAADGVHLVRLEGDWWVERDYPSPFKRLPPDVEQAQFDATAVGFYANGKLVRGYPLNDLITNPLDLKHSPRYVLWAAGGVLNEPAARFVVMTQDATRITFDFRTGEVIARDRIGLNNPLLGRILIACGALSVGILAVWAWFAFGRKNV